jgi:hypothetical protein
LILFGPNLPFCHIDAHKKQILLKWREGLHNNVTS